MRRYMVAVMAALALVLAACAPPAEEPEAAPDPEAEPEELEEPEEPEDEPETDPDAEAEAPEDVDEETLQAAIEEGGVHYWSSIIQPETHEDLAAGFRERYGLDDTFNVDYTLLSTADLATRVDEEIAADAVTVDVISSGAIDHAYELLEAGELMEYDSPSHEDYGPSFEAGLGEEGYWAADGFSLDTPIWNPRFLEDVEVQSWHDIFDYDLDGQIMMGDAENSLTRRLSYYGMRQVLPREFFEDLAELNPGFAVRSEDVVQTSVTGEYPFSFGGMPTRGYQVEEAGVDFELEIAFPEEGIVLLPQYFTILEQAPNPNAAKLWVDFIFSEEGQRIYQGGEALISGREGFETPSEKWAPPAGDIEVIPVDWQAITDEELEEIEAEWLEIFRQ